jgi:hypothetical protein
MAFVPMKQTASGTTKLNTPRFFSVSRWNGGLLSVRLREEMGDPAFIEVEFDIASGRIRIRATDDPTMSSVVNGRVKLTKEIRYAMARHRRYCEATVRYPIDLGDDGWWYTTKVKG